MFRNAGFRLTCRLPHCRFDDDICSTAQAPLAAEGWPSAKQRQANRSITLPLCPPRQIADSWILFNSGAMPLGDKAKAALPLRAATLKQQAMITRQSGKRQASLKPALSVMLKVTYIISHVLKLIKQWFFVDYFSFYQYSCHLPLPMYRNWCKEIQMCLLTKNFFFYKDVLQANNLWKWNHFLAKLCNLTLELCHFTM